MKFEKQAMDAGFETHTILTYERILLKKKNVQLQLTN